MEKRAGFHRLKLDHGFGLMRLARLLRFEVEDLPADHASETGGARQGEDEFGANLRVLVGCGVRRHVEGISQQSVADKNRGGLAIGLVGGRPSPPQIIIVEGGEVVMNEGIAMDHLDRRGGAPNATSLTPNSRAVSIVRNGRNRLPPPRLA